MSHLEQGERGTSHSLAPVQLEGASVDARTLHTLHDGSGKRLLLMVAAVSVFAVGGVKLLDGLDARGAHAAAAAQLARSDGEPRDAFMRCALPGYARSQLDAPHGMRVQLERVTERLQRGYGTVLAGCAPLLISFRHAAQDVTAPADVKPRVGAVSMAAGELAIAWSQLQAQLLQPAAIYDRAQVAPSVAKIDAAWQDYLHARDQAQRALSARR